MKEESWIVIPRWDGQHGFQHYKERRPIWIKNYVELLSKPEYGMLTLAQRGLLHGLWLMYAETRSNIPSNTSWLSSRLNAQVTQQMLKALADAGFIVLSASKPLANRYQDASLEVETETEVLGTSTVQLSKAVTELDHQADNDLEHAPANGTNGPGEIESIADIIQRSLEEARP